MIRGLKTLFLASVLLAALNVAAAQAAEFHCEVETGKSCIATLGSDGTGKTAHQVFVIKKGETFGLVTCSSITGEGTSASKTASELTVAKVGYSPCTMAGAAATVIMNGCDYLFQANGGKVRLVCPESKEMLFVSGGCVVSIPTQEIPGVTYTNINSKKEVTVSVASTGFHGLVAESAECKAIFGFAGTFSAGEYSTGNMVLKGFKDEGGSEGAQVNFWWE